MHSHLAVWPAPSLSGAIDDNSEKAPAQPWLRSLDGLNTHDEGYKLAIAGGVTTSLILPGSSDAIGAISSIEFLCEFPHVLDRWAHSRVLFLF